MKRNLRLLIGYDGSECSSDALADLRRAGLPESAEALVLSASLVMLPPDGSADAEPDEGSADATDPLEVRHSVDRARRELSAARTLAETAAADLAKSFPDWKVRSEVTPDYPSWAIIKAADAWKPDLIVLGSHGRSALGRLVLGSVSQTVLTNARCSVRIGRSAEAEERPAMRLVVGYDGSPDADSALKVISERRWPQGSTIAVVTAYQTWPAAVEAALVKAGVHESGAYAPPAAAAHDLAERAAARLSETGLSVSAHVEHGDPRTAILRAAEGADCVFLGARGISSGIDRFPLGSVALAVAARARCSVEVVRAGEHE